MDKDRQKFEKWALTLPGKPRLNRADETYYSSIETQDLWVGFRAGWQARGSSDRAKGFQAAKEQAAAIVDSDDEVGAWKRSPKKVVNAIRSMTDQGEGNV